MLQVPGKAACVVKTHACPGSINPGDLSAGQQPEGHILPHRGRAREREEREGEGQGTEAVRGKGREREELTHVAVFLGH